MFFHGSVRFLRAAVIRNQTQLLKSRVFWVNFIVILEKYTGALRIQRPWVKGHASKVMLSHVFLGILLFATLCKTALRYEDRMYPVCKSSEKWKIGMDIQKDGQWMYYSVSEPSLADHFFPLFFTKRLCLSSKIGEPLRIIESWFYVPTSFLNFFEMLISHLRCPL